MLLHLGRMVILVVGCVILGAAANAQNNFTWAERSPGVSPVARHRHAMVWHPPTSRAILFGGESGGAYFDDMWEWSGTSWAPIPAAGVRPSARSGHALAYDPVRQRVVLFGGRDANGLLADTWEWNGVVWSPVSTVGPSLREDHAMAYDGVGTLLFGGNNGSDMGDCWRWDGLTWNAQGNGPSPRSKHAMCSAPFNYSLFLYGGTTGSSETWYWWGGTTPYWQQQTWGNPWNLPLGDALATHDESKGVAVIVGFDPAPHTIKWFNLGIGELTPASQPSSRSGASMCYDVMRGETVLFGGLTAQGESAETWTLGSVQFNQSVVGFGCGAASGSLVPPPAWGFEDTCWVMYDPVLTSTYGAIAYPLQFGVYALSTQRLGQPIDLGSLFAGPMACPLHLDPALLCFPVNQAVWWIDELPSIPSQVIALHELYVQGVMVGLGSFGSFYLSTTPAFRIL